MLTCRTVEVGDNFSDPPVSINRTSQDATMVMSQTGAYVFRIRYVSPFWDKVNAHDANHYRVQLLVLLTYRDCLV